MLLASSRCFLKTAPAVRSGPVHKRFRCSAPRPWEGRPRPAAWTRSAIYWNPAAIRTVPGSQVVIGGEAIIPDIHLGSTIPAGTFRAARTNHHGIDPQPQRRRLGLGSRGGLSSGRRFPLTVGMGLVGVGGGSVNFPGGTGNNPILAPTGPFNRFVLGPQAGSATFLSIMPSAALQVTDSIIVGGGPLVDISVPSFDPAFFGPTNDANGDGLSSFQPGAH